MDPIEELVERLNGTKKLRVWSVIITFFGDAIVPRGGSVSAKTVQELLGRMGIEAGACNAELVVTHERLALPVPASVDLADAAAIPEVFLTAWDALVVQGGLTSGRWALVHAGASGVGTAAIQIANNIAHILFGSNHLHGHDRLQKHCTTLLRKLLVLGSVVGFAVLTKQGTIGLIPLTWGTLFLIGWQSSLAEHPQPQQTFQDLASQIGKAIGRSLIWFAIFFIPILIIAGWCAETCRSVQLQESSDQASRSSQMALRDA